MSFISSYAGHESFLEGSGGYSQSEWVAEQHLRDAGRRGVCSYTIIRPGLLEPHGITGFIFFIFFESFFFSSSFLEFFVFLNLFLLRLVVPHAAARLENQRHYQRTPQFIRDAGANARGCCCGLYCPTAGSPKGRQVRKLQKGVVRFRTYPL
jgi:hypothetical protein